VVRVRAAFTAGFVFIFLPAALPPVLAQPQSSRARVRQDDVLGTVAGRAITRSEVDQVWRSKDPATFFSFQQRRHEMTMHALREIMAEALLAREAERRGTTVDVLIATEVNARGRPVSDEAVRSEFERMKASLPYTSFDEARPMVESALTQRQAAEARAAFVEALLEQARDLIEIYEEPPRQDVLVDGSDPAAGAPGAPLTLVVFSDFQCPYCRQLEPTLAALQARFGDQLRLVWKDFPLPIHPESRAAAAAARCAGEQGAFWRYRDELFRNQGDLSEPRLRMFAEALGLDERAFAACLRSNRFDAIIEAKLDEGRALGVTSTPTMFINGVVVTGAVPQSRLEQLMRDELRLLGK
jgi:protein-disulfide isomerase